MMSTPVAADVHHFRSGVVTAKFSLLGPGSAKT